MDTKTVQIGLVVWVVSVTLGGIGLVLVGDPLTMGAGSVLIIFGLVSLMPLMYTSLD